MAYVTYDYYNNTYGGTAVPSSSFTPISIKASAFIDYITFNRIKELETIPEEVQLATCAVIDSMKKIEKEGGIRASESTGNHSVSYVVDSMASNEKSRYYAEAEMYLVNTGLLYSGVI